MKCESCSSTDIARSLLELQPEERMLILLKDALGLNNGPIGSIMEIEKPDLPSAINKARHHLARIHPSRTPGSRLSHAKRLANVAHSENDGPH